jgi:hypothetical protein
MEDDTIIFDPLGELRKVVEDIKKVKEEGGNKDGVQP